MFYRDWELIMEDILLCVGTYFGMNIIIASFIIWDNYDMELSDLCELTFISLILGIPLCMFTTYVHGIVRIRIGFNWVVDKIMGEN